MLVIKKLYGIIIHGAIIHVKVAAYFASLEPAQPRPQSGIAAFVPKPSALQAGKNDMPTLLGADCHSLDMRWVTDRWRRVMMCGPNFHWILVAWRTTIIV